MTAANGAGAAVGDGDVHVITVAGSINPGVSDFVSRRLDDAVAGNAACFIIALDTPGGLAESMRDIVQVILQAPIPVVVYVSPSGARAASAGVMITMAADIAAMAPGTNIGAAHPVGAGGAGMDETMAGKVVNDMAAHARSIAEKRGRNAQWVEQAIRESVSVTETEAVADNIVDLVAVDLADLVQQIDGRRIRGKGVLSVSPQRIRHVAEDFRTKVLRALSDPNIAYILMMIGMAGLYFELSHPGAVFPGVIGAVCLVLSFFAFQTLPVNYAGMLLIFLSLVFFILELKVTSFGMLTVAGIVALLIGSLMLFEDGPGGVRLAFKVLVATVGMVSFFFIAVAALVLRAHATRPRSGAGGLVGEHGVVKTRLDPVGKVFVHGELWRAEASTPIPEGATVVVVAVRGLMLSVRPLGDATQVKAV